MKRPHADLPELTVAELDELLWHSIEESEDELLAFEERIALSRIDDGRTTAERAIDALQRPERFRGEHDVARAWLRQCHPMARIFRRVSS
ncbi:MAG TPA: hypothetical protein VI585_00145 [Candidatus Binatia bacterium]